MPRLARWLAALMLHGPDAAFIKHDLEDMYARDPAVLIGMTLTFAACGLLATAWPARAAASLDSATALKE